MLSSLRGAIGMRAAVPLLERIARKASKTSNYKMLCIDLSLRHPLSFLLEARLRLLASACPPAAQHAATGCGAGRGACSKAQQR